MRTKKKKQTQNPDAVNVITVQDLAEMEEEDTITVPLAEIFHQLRKYLLPWFLLAVILGGLVFGSSLLRYSSSSTPLTALIEFTYDGIEEGLDPSGNEFDVNTVKTPSLVQDTLTDLGISEKKTDSVRNGLTIYGVVPDDAIDELTAYKSIFDSTNSIEAAKQMMNVSYNPTQFEVQFNYSGLDFSRAQAADFLNTLLSNYRTYFMRTYGFNEAFGDALTAIDYSSYDYPQALDLFGDSLNSLQTYVKSLANDDTTRFRSNETGYTFSDLQAAVDTLKTVDYATLTSYVLGKNVTKDKDALQTYYQYQIDTLNRSLTSAQEKLATIVESIEKYQKDSIVIMAGSDGTTDTTLTQSSEAYDDLITQKISAQESVSNYQSKITDYTTRLETLKKTSTASKSAQEEADAQVKSVGDKINQLISDVNTTADEYFETASYANAYNVLVPASGSVTTSLSGAFSAMQRPLLIVEAFLFVAYLVFGVVRGFLVSNRREKLAAAAAEKAETEADTTSEAELLEKVEKTEPSEKSKGSDAK